MAAVHKIAGGFAVSISTLAAEFGMGRDTVAKRLDRAGIAPTGEAKGYPTYRLRDACKAILGVSVDRRASLADDEDGADPCKLPPNERLAWMRSESERLKVATAKGELIPATHLEAELAKTLKMVVQALDTLPDKLERHCALPPAAVDKVIEALDELRGELHAELTAEPDEV